MVFCFIFSFCLAQKASTRDQKKLTATKDTNMDDDDDDDNGKGATIFPSISISSDCVCVCLFDFCFLSFHFISFICIYYWLVGWLVSFRFVSFVFDFRNKENFNNLLISNQMYVFFFHAVLFHQIRWISIFQFICKIKQ